MQFVRRKWGWYLTLLDRKHFKVKLLKFARGKQLSFQYHDCRNELWLYLTGLNAGCYRYIPKGEKHTYYAMVPTYILEIQYGDKCIEGDITRV